MLQTEFNKIFKYKADFILAGSYHLGKKTSGDIDIIISVNENFKNFKNLNENFKNLKENSKNLNENLNKNLN